MNCSWVCTNTTDSLMWFWMFSGFGKYLGTNPDFMNQTCFQAGTFFHREHPQYHTSKWKQREADRAPNPNAYRTVMNWLSNIEMRTLHPTTVNEHNCCRQQYKVWRVWFTYWSSTYSECFLSLNDSELLLSWSKTVIIVIGLVQGHRAFYYTVHYVPNMLDTVKTGYNRAPKG